MRRLGTRRSSSHRSSPVVLVCLLLLSGYTSCQVFFAIQPINWRGKPLTSFETVIELISHTTTRQGLTVTAVKDSNSYPTGITVSDEDLATLNIKREPFHGDWNYTIQPQESVLLFQ
jgi:hypothetical protein